MALTLTLNYFQKNLKNCCRKGGGVISTVRTDPDLVKEGKNFLVHDDSYEEYIGEYSALSSDTLNLLMTNFGKYALKVLLLEIKSFAMQKKKKKKTKTKIKKMKKIKVLLSKNITMIEYYPQNQVLKGNCKDYIHTDKS